MLWHQEILSGLVTGGWVQRGETLCFVLNHSIGEDLLSHQMVSLAIRENCLSSYSLSYPSSGFPSICHRRLIWKTVWGSASDFHPTCITSQTRAPKLLALPMAISRASIVSSEGQWWFFCSTTSFFNHKNLHFFCSISFKPSFPKQQIAFQTCAPVSAAA